MKNMILLKKDKDLFLKLFLLFSPFLFGGYHIWTSALFAIVLAVYMVCTISTKEKVSINISLLSLLLLPVAYLVVSLWAVDSGTAVYGFVKLLPVGLFGLIVSSKTKEEKESLFDCVPLSAAVMGVVSYGLSFVPSLEDYFLVATRLGGFFQYPNTFAIYCIVGIAVLLTKEKVAAKQWTLSAILTGLVFLTGSRTSFVFLVFTVAALFFKVQKKNKIKLLVLFGTAVAASLVIVIITDSIQTVGRFLTISLESSTLLGRLLYYKDALPVILKNPFGLGYYGYYFSQGSFQTGVYSVAFIHNEFLQLLLDIGWVPSLLFFCVLALSLFSKKTAFTQKLILFIIAGHSFFDFDLQYTTVFFILILCFDFETFAVTSYRLKKSVAIILTVAVSVVALYFGLINVLFLLDKYEVIEKIYGKDTQSQIFLITEADNYDEIVVLADSITERNKYISIAYSAKSNYAYSEGDILKMIEEKEKAIAVSKYSIDEYNDYCTKLIGAVNAYNEIGDEESALYCAKKILEIKDDLAELEENTSSFAFKIQRKPSFELLEEYEEYIDYLSEIV